MSSEFYSSIASYYEQIFPANPAQIEFLRHVLPYNGAKILDVGCATGDLSFALTQFGFPVWAFDYDPLMVEKAKQKKQEDLMFPVFEQLDMLKIGERYPESYFETVICFGNTLVHLLADEDVESFFKAAFKVLAPEGKLTLQILNYDHILGKQISSLPLIDNEHIRFERNYTFFDNSNLIDFNTKLTVKSTGQEIHNSVKLNPIKKEKLIEMMEKAGFSQFELHGSFKRTSLQENDLPLIVTSLKC